MADSIEKLKEIVRELEDELHELSAVDEQAAELLQEAVREIQTVLQSRQLDARSAVEREPEPLDEDLQPDASESVIDRLNRAAHQFENSHPTLTGILSRLIDGLGQMGI
jgi:predicted ribosome quality control (RQC) complex YloA/Tae2 family protein